MPAADSSGESDSSQSDEPSLPRYAPIEWGRWPCEVGIGLEIHNHAPYISGMGHRRRATHVEVCSEVQSLRDEIDRLRAEVNRLHERLVEPDWSMD